MSYWRSLVERARLYDLKEVGSGGSNYSAPRRPWFVNDQQKKTGMKPGEFRLRKRRAGERNVH